jgi:hypothetical protein
MPPPVTLMEAGGLPRVNTLGAVPHTVVGAGAVGITLVDDGAPPVTLLNEDGTLWSALTDLDRILALSPSLLIWPANGAGWQGTSGGTLAASGQPLGLGADLSQLQGKTLSEWLATAPELVTNGGFATDTDWTKGTGWTISGGAANKSAGVTSNLSQTSMTITAGVLYVLTYTVTRSAGNLQPILGGGLGTLRSASGTYTDVILTSTTATLAIVGDNLFVGSIDNISLKALPGNHLRAGTWASPADSARALLTAGGALNFDSVNDFYSLLNAISITTNMTVVRAFKRAGAGIVNIGIGETSAAVYDALWGTDNNTYLKLGGSALSAGAGSTATGSFVYSGLRNASAQYARRNGTQIGTGAAPAVSGAFNAVGRSTVYNSGEISFLAVFPTELTGADLALVEQIAAGTNGAALA